MKERKQSTTSYPMCFLMVSSTDHVTPVTGLSPTVTISKNGGAFASPSGAVSEIGNGWYALAGNATDRETLGELLIHATGTGSDPVDDRYMVVSYDPFDSVRLGLTALPNAAANAAGGLPISDAGELDLDTLLATLTNGTYGLSAIETLVDDLESRLTATRAGYLDNLSEGAVALASGVTVTTNNDKTGYTASTVSDKTGYALSPSGIVDVWSYSNRTLTSVDNAFPRGEAVNNLTFLMKSSTNHVSGATGLTVSGVVRKDSGSFAEVTGSISEIAYGLYGIDTISTTEMDAKVVTLRFFATGADDTFIELITI